MAGAVTLLLEPVHGTGTQCPVLLRPEKERGPCTIFETLLLLAHSHCVTGFHNLSTWKGEGCAPPRSTKVGSSSMSAKQIKIWKEHILLMRVKLTN